MNISQWTPERDAILIHKWKAGLSAGRISDDMKTGKNAVIGRAHRLMALGQIKKRESPIKGGAPAKRKVKRVGVITGRGAAVIGNTLAELGVTVAAAPVAVPAPVLTYEFRPQPCCWPMGEPKTAGFRYCDAPGIPGRSYCAEHHALAYIPAKAEPSEKMQAAARANIVKGRSPRMLFGAEAF